MTNSPNTDNLDGKPESEAVARFGFATTDSQNSPIDGLALWESEAASAAAHLGLIRLTANERYLISFTTSVVRCECHFIDTADYRGYVQCLGQGCILCLIGRSKEQRDLLPFYDLLDRAVGILPVSPNQRPGALRPQLEPLLKQLRADKPPFLISVCKDGFAKFIVTSSPLPDGSDDGAAVIAEFARRMEAGEVDLTSVFPRLENEALAEIPEIARVISARGLQV